VIQSPNALPRAILAMQSCTIWTNKRIPHHMRILGNGIPGAFVHDITFLIDCLAESFPEQDQKAFEQMIGHLSE
jgi:hypothetical protein